MARFQKVSKKSLVGVALVALGSAQAQAAVLTENVAFDLGDVTFVFGGMIVAGIALYSMKKAKSFIGA